MRRSSIVRDEAGSSAAEFALVLPMLMALLYVGFESGNLMWTQHKLIEAVREGVRLGARLDVDDWCGGDATKLAAAKTKVILFTRTGQVANADASPRIGGWTSSQVRVDVKCDSFVDTGIYTDLGKKGPMIAVQAVGVMYPSLFAGLGGIKRIPLTASAKSPVTGL